MTAGKCIALSMIASTAKAVHSTYLDDQGVRRSSYPELRWWDRSRCREYVVPFMRRIDDIHGALYAMMKS